MQKSFDRDFLILLHTLAGLMRTRADQVARTHGMTRAQWIILARLGRQQGLSQNELAVICEVEPITIARQIDKLEARGLVERRPDPMDRRIWRLHVLPAAKPLIAEITDYREALNDECLGGIDSETQEFVIDTLLQIKSNLTANATKAAALESVEE
ncbi:MAG TPA: MarR family transcriptional regulator [Rhizomicrobium sp.]|jgi:DNA-binding MarR family transcriptional regulator|nr:MarR family transcriptional regulator [Rhizomicrobium sp.]